MTSGRLPRRWAPRNDAISWQLCAKQILAAQTDFCLCKRSNLFVHFHNIIFLYRTLHLLTLLPVEHRSSPAYPPILLFKSWYPQNISPCEAGVFREGVKYDYV